MGQTICPPSFRSVIGPVKLYNQISTFSWATNLINMLVDGSVCFSLSNTEMTFYLDLPFFCCRCLCCRTKVGKWWLSLVELWHLGNSVSAMKSFCRRVWGKHCILDRTSLKTWWAIPSPYDPIASKSNVCANYYYFLILPLFSKFQSWRHEPVQRRARAVLWHSMKPCLPSTAYAQHR